MISVKLTRFCGATLLSTCALGMLLSSCSNSVVFDDLPRCVPEYRLRLSYTHNLANQEKVSQVEAAEVYAFDEEGNLASIARANLDELRENDWTIPLDLERDRPYDLVIWGGLTDKSPFSLDGSRAFSSTGDLTCRLTTAPDAEGNGISSNEFPGLFHSTASVTYTVVDGPEERTAHLVKDTNVLDVILKRLAGSTVLPGQFNVRVIDSNDVLLHDNSVAGENVHYIPATQTNVEMAEPDGQGGSSADLSEVLDARLHLSRLMKNSDAKIIITEDATGKTMFEQPLVELLLAAKPYIAPGMDDQEYLDRQDEYSIWFTLPSDEKWLHFTLYINGWVIVNDYVEWN